MKLVIVFMAVLALVYGDYKKNNEFNAKMLEQVIKSLEKCTKVEKLSEDDLKDMENEKIPTRKAGKCLISCIYQEIGLQDKDGKITKEGVEKSLVHYKSEDIKLYNDLFKLMIETCLSQVKSTDRCEAATEITVCYEKNASPEMKKANHLYV